MELEHVNLTVSDPEKSAEILGRIFGWHVRWSGPSLMGGRTVHVGTDDRYLALYTPGDPGPAIAPTTRNGMRRPTSVTMGRSALRAAWPITTRKELRPFALAVRT